MGAEQVERLVTILELVTSCFPNHLPRWILEGDPILPKDATFHNVCCLFTRFAHRVCPREEFDSILTGYGQLYGDYRQEERAKVDCAGLTDTIREIIVRSQDLTSITEIGLYELLFYRTYGVLINAEADMLFKGTANEDFTRKKFEINDSEHRAFVEQFNAAFKE